MARRKRVEPTDEWTQLELLLEWPEQVEYERGRPLIPGTYSPKWRTTQPSSARSRTAPRHSSRPRSRRVERSRRP